MKLITSQKKTRFPDGVDPMLCTPTETPIDDPAFLHEIKFDGYRIIAYVNKGNVILRSRGKLDYTSKYPLVVEALKNLAHDVVLDGEMVIFNEQGRPDFKAVQNYNGQITPITFCTFDVLWLDGYDLMQLPLEKRKSLLSQLLGNSTIVRYTDSFNDGPALYREMQRIGWEGIISKKRDSPYIPGQRKEKWLKTPIKKRQEFVIGGWAESDKARAFRGLLIGAYVNGHLTWIGRSGSGFKEVEMQEILAKLKKKEQKTSPFINKVLDTKGAKIHWLKPDLVGIFEYAELIMYDDPGKPPRIRKPAIFQSLRSDKNPKDVVLEIPKSTREIEQLVHDEKGRSTTPSKPRKAGSTMPIPSRKKKARGNWKYIDQEQKIDPDTLNFENCAIEVYNLDRHVWPDFTKLELLNWYHQMAPYILPYLKDRPVTLNPRLNGANAPGFYLHDMLEVPSCANLYTTSRRHEKEDKPSGEPINNLVINNEATLLWTINLGCIDCNPWNSRVDSIDTPDYIVIDLDAPKKAKKDVYIDKLRRTGVATQKYLKKMKLVFFVKTSGRTGLHFLIPCVGLTWKQCRGLAVRICDEIHSLVPEETTREEQKKDRGSVIYLDASQNDYGDTARCVYCVAPHNNKNVSAPLEPLEIATVDPDKYTIETISNRVKKKGDLFKGLLMPKNATANSAILKRMMSRE